MQKLGLNLVRQGTTAVGGALKQPSDLVSTFRPRQLQGEAAIGLGFQYTQAQNPLTADASTLTFAREAQLRFDEITLQALSNGFNEDVLKSLDVGIGLIVRAI